MDQLNTQGDTNIANAVMNMLNAFVDHDIFPDYLESACWADNLYNDGGMRFTMYTHFIDTPYNPHNLSIIPENNYNITSALIDINKVLTSNNKNPYTNMTWIKAINLRLLIHLIGDLHQPLHASEYYSEKYPNGDRGGNEFHVLYSKKSEITNLHMLWDWMFGFTPDIMPPVPEDVKTKIRQLSTQEMSDFPISGFTQEIKILDGKKIAMESFAFAVSNAYVNITAESEVSDQYFNTNLALCRKRVALAGYRLSVILKNMIKAQSSTEQQSE